MMCVHLSLQAFISGRGFPRKEVIEKFHSRGMLVGSIAGRNIRRRHLASVGLLGVFFMRWQLQTHKPSQTQTIHTQFFVTAHAPMPRGQVAWCTPCVLWRRESTLSLGRGRRRVDTQVRDLAFSEQEAVWWLLRQVQLQMSLEAFRCF